MTLTATVRNLIVEARGIFDDTRKLSHASHAWNLLQERDADGNTGGTLPYTGEAIDAFQTAHDYDPENPTIVHHLAIAHHARAWDLELKNDSQAAQEWEIALGHWRTIAASAPFWDEQKRQLKEADPDADEGFVDELRRDLVEHLLDVHVDFIRQYCEGKAHPRAVTHIELIRRARISPVVKKRLLPKVFDAITVAVPEAKQRQEYGSALSSIEQFLALFPEYPPALRMYLEVCKDWISMLSYQDAWPTIVALSQRAVPVAEQGVGLEGFAKDVTARANLAELAHEFAMRAHRRGFHLLNDRALHELDPYEQEEVLNADNLAIAWGQLAVPHCASTAAIRSLLALCLRNRVIHWHNEAIRLNNAGVAGSSRLLDLYRKALADSEEALALEENDKVRENVALFQKRIDFVEDYIDLHGEDIE